MRQRNRSKPNVSNVHGHLHQWRPQSPQHLNVSIERLGYRPQKLATRS